MASVHFIPLLFPPSFRMFSQPSFAKAVLNPVMKKSTIIIDLIFIMFLVLRRSFRFWQISADLLLKNLQNLLRSFLNLREIFARRFGRFYGFFFIFVYCEERSNHIYKIKLCGLLLVRLLRSSQ